MTEYDNTNRGSVWPNNKKTDKHPDYTGSININGVEYWLNMWNNSRNANPKAPTHNFSVNKKEDVPKHYEPKVEQAQGAGITADDLNDEVPFGPIFI